MNIFYLNACPKIAAQQHCDKHTVKMILESAQLLSTAHRILDGKEIEGKSKTGRKAKRWILPDEREFKLYNATHINHPSAVWCRETSGNYVWLYRLFFYLCDEYKYRYGKTHKCAEMREALYLDPFNITSGVMTQMPQCMPDEYKVSGDSVQAYHNYYIGAKAGFAKWTKREVPDWWNAK